MTGMYLEHYGVLGMKWGVRRYQNADGTLTEAGRKKYTKAYSNLANKYAWKAAKYNRRAEERTERARKKGKDPSLLSGILSYSDKVKAASYTEQAQRLVDAIVPELRSVSWSDVEKKGVYLDMMYWKTPKWADKRR